MRAPAVLLLLAACLGACQALEPAARGGESLSSAGSGGFEKWKRPEFCGKLDCPPFKVLKKTDNWELRRYKPGKWLVTQINDTKFELAYTKGASRLLKYFKGGNAEQRGIPLTTPTVAELKLVSGGESSELTYLVMLWLPGEVQKEPPQPTEADIMIADFPEFQAYFRVFGGFATEGTILQESQGLRGILIDDNEDFWEDMVYVCVYDAPTKVLHRHNEVAVPAGRKESEGQVPAS